MSKKRDPAKKDATPATPPPVVEEAAAAPPVKDGLCPSGCQSYDASEKCPCGEGHRLSMQQHTIVHYKGEHWNAACAFVAVIGEHEGCTLAGTHDRPGGDE